MCPACPWSRLPRDAAEGRRHRRRPLDLRCIPATARRPVVISTQLAPSYEPGYFRDGRARMFATLRAYYGSSDVAIADLRRRYGATHLWVRRRALVRETAHGGARWREWEQPYGRFVGD